VLWRRCVLARTADEDEEEEEEEDDEEDAEAI
jgi:hypothetical protein